MFLSFTYSSHIPTMKLSLKGLLSAVLLLTSLSAEAQNSVPYTHAFDAENSLEGFTAINQNNDAYAWTYDASQHAAKSSYGDGGLANDWLISPQVSLQAGKTYKVSYSLKSYNNNGETLGIYLGQGTTAAALSQTIVGQTDMELSYLHFANYDYEFTVAADGNYNLGLHHTTQSLFFGGSLFVQSLSVTEAGGGTVVTVVPAAPTLTLTVLSDVEPYSVNVKVKTPAVDTDGNPLTALQKLEVLRDGVVIFSVADPYVNSTVRTDDENVPEGKHIYSAVAYSTDGTKGEVAQKEQSFGIVPDAAPKAVTELQATYNPSSLTATISWKAPALSVEDKPLNQPVTYNIRRKGNSEPLATGLTTCTYTDVVDMVGQANSAYYVTAENESGKSSEVKSNDLFIGTPYELPFAETAANGNLQNAWAITRTGSSRWGASDLGSIAYDNDRGYITICPLMENDGSTITSGYINIAEAANPVLRFHYFYVMPNDDEFYLTLSADGGEPVQAWSFDYEASGNTERWMEVDIPVKEYLANASYFQMAFTARFAMSQQPIIYLDDITVIDKKSQDLALTLVKAPRNLKPGESRSAILSLENLGGNDVAAGAAQLVANVDGKSIFTADAPKVKAGKRLEITLEDICLDVFNTADQVELAFSVIYPEDEQEANNVTESVIVPTKPVYVAAPAQVTIADNTLSWTAPVATEVTSEPMTESFEDAPSFTISDFGEWSMYDALNTTVYGLTDASGADVSFPHTCEPQAWTVLDFAFGGFYDSVQPHTGDKAMAAFSHAGMTENSWLISPELSGQEQTLSFYAKAIASHYTEKLEISYTTSAGMALSTFQVLDDSETILSTTWKEYSFELPEGTRYFAIRATSRDALCQLVDDVTFIPEAQGQPCTQVTGYNVYCDGEIIYKAKANENSLTLDQGDHQYHVTALYSTGESAPVLATVGESGISTLDADQVLATIYSLSGQRVDANYRGLVICRGQKFLAR